MRDSRIYWTLHEAGAWVVFRSPEVVDRFSPPDPESWGAFMVYSRAKHPRIESTADLLKALCDGRLVAVGRRSNCEDRVEEIRAIEWQDLIFDVEGPYRRRTDGSKSTPWEDIRVPRADVERLWRRTSEVEARTKYDKAWLQQQYARLKEEQPSLSKNELILELQDNFEAEFKRAPPSRTSLQRYLKNL